MDTEKEQVLKHRHKQIVIGVVWVWGVHVVVHMVGCGWMWYGMMFCVCIGCCVMCVCSCVLWFDVCVYVVNVCGVV